MSRHSPFWDKVDASGDCWEWTAARNAAGYGIGWTGERTRLAHRMAWEELVGPIPKGLELDHLCRNRACINPDHLEPVTKRINTIRGFGPAGLRARSKQCKRGHEWTEENTRWYRGYRMCRACNREDCRVRYLRRVEWPAEDVA